MQILPSDYFQRYYAPFTYLAVFMANATLYFVCVVTGIMMQFALHTGH